MRLRWAATIVLTCGALVAAGIWAPEVRAWRGEAARETAEAAPAAVEKVHEKAIPEPETPELAKTGPIPANGPGTFIGATDGGPLLGDNDSGDGGDGGDRGDRGEGGNGGKSGDGSGKGRLKRVRVAVESNLADELGALTAAVDTTLGDPRSWAAGGSYRFQRVPYNAAFDFTIYLVTRETAYAMCRVNGVDIRVDGVPYTSCRQVHKVIINVDRWRLSVPPYVDNRVPLSAYRSYVINHEVGHELGRGHVGCPAAGQPAPVMLTQTLGLQGCTPNPWPYP